MKSSEIDWVRLYLLNALIDQPSRVSYLVICPKEGLTPYWEFPGRDFLRASPEQRLDALRVCCREQEIIVYEPDKGARKYRAVPSEEIHLRVKLDLAALRPLRAMISHRGHDIWESLYQPDWTRYWRIDDKRCSQEGEHSVLLNLTCATETILDEVLQHAPLLFDLDRRTGVQQVTCSTAFAPRVAVWKILPTAIEVELSGISDVPELNEMIHRHTRRDAEALKRILRNRYLESRLIGKRVERLSMKWICVDDRSLDDGSQDQRDCLPGLLLRD